MSDLAKANATLPQVRVLTREFRTLLTLNNGIFAARQGLNSTYEFQLTLTDVEPGATQKKLELLVTEMNAQFPNMKNYQCTKLRPETGFQVRLSSIRDLPTYDERGDITFTCSSMLNDSTNRHRSKDITSGSESRISQEAFLRHLRLEEQPNNIVKVMGGLWWLAQGEFPTPYETIGFGNRGDPRDPFEGGAVRTHKGQYSGDAVTHPYGIGSRFYVDTGHADPSVGIVGGPPPKFKKRER
jgi:hypothetical protein